MGLLLSADSDPNARLSTDGRAPLVVAAKGGYTSVVSLLLNAGANKNEATYDNGDTPLLAAVESDNVEVVRLLLDARADVWKANLAGATPLRAAEASGASAETRAVLARADSLRKLQHRVREIRSWEPSAPRHFRR